MSSTPVAPRGQPPLDRRGILVLAKVGAILQAFSGDLERAGPSELAARVGLNKSTTFRILSSLEDTGLLDRAPDGTYALGIWLIELGALVGERLDIRKIAEPLMRDLREATSQTVFLTTRYHHDAVCVERLPGSHVEVMALRLGGHLPLYCGAGPRVLMSALSDNELETYLAETQFVARTPHTLIDASALREDVELTRRQGYVLSMEDVTLDMGALGAPIRDRDGRVVAALSIADLRHTYEGEALPRLISLVSAAASRSSQALGYKDNAASA